MPKHEVVSHEEWLRARTAFLAEEKAHMKRGDALAAARRALPWEKVTKSYVFDGVSLLDLFGRASQLIVYHFMFPPEDKEGCKHCSFWADHYDGMQVHLAHRDVAFTAISRAPQTKIEKFKKRMGWKFRWVSSGGTDFNYDFGASFADPSHAFFNYREGDAGMHDREGISVFARDRKTVFHTYSTYARGIEMVNGTYHFLDLVPKGRDEGKEPQSWVRYHDRYED
jgi:predicted dithiol-disulfide oxidoreductase (DUF899 family)